jgi:hypothetical protein
VHADFIAENSTGIYIKHLYFFSDKPQKKVRLDVNDVKLKSLLV